MFDPGAELVYNSRRRASLEQAGVIADRLWVRRGASGRATVRGRWRRAVGPAGRGAALHAAPRPDR